MIIVNCDKVKAVENKGDMVKVSPVYRKSLMEGEDYEGYHIISVTFEPGARLNFHTHTFPQILYITEGKGIVATREKEYMVTPGDVIFIPSGEDHWHGATKDSSFTHLAVYQGESEIHKQ